MTKTKIKEFLEEREELLKRQDEFKSLIKRGEIFEAEGYDAAMLNEINRRLLKNVEDELKKRMSNEGN